jgi:hypothetical protein
MILYLDASALENLLIAVGGLAHPEIDDREAMLRVHTCPAAVFLAAEEDGRPVGLVRGVYDGSRALIHLLAYILTIKGGASAPRWYGKSPGDSKHGVRPPWV